MKEKIILMDYLKGEFKVGITHTCTLLIVTASCFGLAYCVMPMFFAGMISLSMLIAYCFLLSLAWWVVFKVAGKYYRQFLFSHRMEDA